MIIGTVIVVVLMIIISEFAWVRFNGRHVPRPVVSGAPSTLGSGPILRFVVLGDSTAVSQGGEYKKGYASAVAAHLARDHTVTWQNVAIPGARAGDVAQKQIPQVTEFRADIALVAVGANDVTHLTSIASVHDSLRRAIAQLRQSNPDMTIILTGSPDMGSVPRFGPVLRWAAGERTRVVNRMIENLASTEGVKFAPIAERTGSAFRANPGLFAADKFHPTSEGYALWTPVIIETLER